MKLSVKLNMNIGVMADWKVTEFFHFLHCFYFILYLTLHMFNKLFAQSLGSAYLSYCKATGKLRSHALCSRCVANYEIVIREYLML
jgi:hypothetical protein